MEITRDEYGGFEIVLRPRRAKDTKAVAAKKGATKKDTAKPGAGRAKDAK